MNLLPLFLLLTLLSIPAWPQEAVLLYTGDTRAFLEVCGCAEEQLGGIARRGTLVERYRASGLPVLLVDAGGWVEGEEERDRLRVETYARAMKLLGYDAVNLGQDEFHFGAEFLQDLARGLPFVSANSRQPLAGVSPSLVRSLGQWQIGILGVGAPQPEHFLPPEEALATAIARLRPAVDYLVLLSDLEPAAEAALAARFPALDLIISRRGNTQPQKGGALIAPAAPQGTRLGLVRLRAGPDGRPIAAGAALLPVSAKLPGLEAVERLVAAFYDTVARRADMQVPRRSPFAGYPAEADPANAYTGAVACLPCHPQEHASWRATPHAQALNTLLQRNRHFFPDCVSCHTTGFGLDSGFAIGKDREYLGGVQCEVCHGPGRQHVVRPEKVNIRRAVDPQFCQGCHTPQQSPGFIPREHFAQVDHRHWAEPPVEKALRRRLRQGGKAELELFVMSLCPYGMQAERALLPLVERFGDQVELNIYFIASPQDAPTAPRPLARPPARAGCAAAAASGDGPFASLHGQPEIDEGRRQLIARRDSPGRFRAYLLCRSRQGPQGDWQECARAAGIDPDSLQAAAAGPQGEQFFRENIQLANSLGIDLSPTLFIDGEEFTGDFAPLPLARRLCRDRPQHPLCQSLPACGSDADCQAPPGKVGLCRDPDTPRARCEYCDPVRFVLQVLNTQKCGPCNTGAFLASTLELFPQARVETRELESDEGEKIARQYGIQVFPAYIFSAAFARSPRFERVQHLLQPRGEGYLLAPRLTSATYWPRRPLQPGRLDVFLPAGDQEGEEEVLSQWPQGNEGIHLHHLLPGPASADEELEVRACLGALQPGRYPAYAAARRAAGDWKNAARQAGAQVEALASCLDSGQGRLLLGAVAAVADSLELDPGSTSALIENQVLLRRARPEDFIPLWQRGMVP